MLLEQNNQTWSRSCGRGHDVDRCFKIVVQKRGDTRQPENYWLKGTCIFDPKPLSIRNFSGDLNLRNSCRTGIFRRQPRMRLFVAQARVCSEQANQYTDHANDVVTWREFPIFSFEKHVV